MDRVWLWIRIVAFCTYFAVVLVYLATLFALIRALRRNGVELGGGLFDRAALPNILLAVVTNRYAHIADPDVRRFTRSARVLLAAGLVLFSIMFMSFLLAQR